MGTRADFYVGTGPLAEWLGSIGDNGSPRNQDLRSIFLSTTQSAFRDAVKELLTCAEGTTPELGWPWPWENSSTTDYAYAFTGDGVLFSHYGSPWRSVSEPECIAPFDWCSHYAWVHFPAAKGTRYGSQQWLGILPPRFSDAIAFIKRGIRYKMGGMGSRGSSQSSRDYMAEPAYWWVSIAGRPDHSGMVRIARCLKDGSYRLLPGVQLVFPPTAVSDGKEILSEPGALIDRPRKKEPVVDAAVFPDMSANSNVTLGPRSGLIVLGPKGIDLFPDN